MYKYIIIALLLFAAACGSKLEYIQIIEPPARYIYGFLSNPVSKSGTAPLTVEYRIGVYYPSYDSNQQNPVSRIGIDTGTGFGFTDVTDKAMLIDGELHYELSYSFTYVDPGSYPVQVRAVYWDGEVVTYTYPYTIEVLPPEDGDDGA